MSQFGRYPTTRLRRLRQHHQIRALIRETELNPTDFVLPLFIRHGTHVKKPIQAMPGHYQYSVDCLAQEIKDIAALGIKHVMLFGIPDTKDSLGQAAYQETGVIQSAISLIKSIAPQMLVITDLCFCEYTDHGHCGVITEPPHPFAIENDKTLALLAKQAISHAASGADIIAPSGMMDGMIHAIRHALDTAHFHDIPLLSYAVKYASSLYGPFREAAEGAPQSHDRRSHQMDPANQSEAIRECALDIAEGADMLMVKPAHTYLDIIAQVKKTYPYLPLAAYHTSGEYAMVKAAASKGWVDEKETALEILTGIRRAGADFIITYFAKDAVKWLS
ncbi:MAG TPA: porphobilinogen synthase [Gammaproteobacteria bacterium]|jgi:porphobilinogen synthase|nr:porphobilinogen synthase [Gammaproteobacteria bacterium]